MLSQNHKTFVITGANTGIGFETAKALAKKGGHVVLAVRDAAKGDAALKRIQEATGNDRLSLQILDLADLSSIARAGAALNKQERIDVLINNAGLGSTQAGTTKDGFPLVMGTNHLGTFAFTEAVLPKLLATARTHGEARLINLSSAAHQFARNFDPADLFPQKRRLKRDAYSESKLANLLHARELARRYGALGLRAHAVHPGFVRSDFGRQEHFPGPWQAVFTLTRPFQISAEKGARTTLAAALSDDAAWNNGLYWDRESPVQPTLPKNPDKVAETLWETSEKLLASKGFVVEHQDEDDDQITTVRDSAAFPDGL